MKRLQLWLLFLTLVFPSGAYSAPVYGTDTPKKGEVSIGYQTNIVFKHELSNEHGLIKSTQHFVDFSYGVYDWFIFDGKVGVGNAIHDEAKFQKVHYDTSFAGGYGFRIPLFNNEKNKTRMVFGFHHVSVHGRDQFLNGDKYESFLDDWQFSLVGSKGFKFIDPFLGFKVSRFDLGYRINHDKRKRNPPRYYTGIVTGCGVNLGKETSFKIEGHFIDETSLSAGIYYKY